MIKHRCLGRRVGNSPGMLPVRTHSHSLMSIPARFIQSYRRRRLNRRIYILVNMVASFFITLEVVDLKNFDIRVQLVISSLTISNLSRFCSCFRFPHNMGSCRWKTHTHFPNNCPFKWSRYLDISIHFLKNRQNITNNTIFVGGSNTIRH